MFDILTETFLYEFFAEDAILRDHYDRKSRFFSLSELFCLPRNDIAYLFDVTESELVREIQTKNDSNRWKRIAQFNKLSGNTGWCSEIENMLAYIKSDAIDYVDQCGMVAFEGSSKTLIVKTLMGGAEIGNILALRMLGILRCEGVLVEKNTAKGVSDLKRAMQWGDIPSILALFAYSDEDKVSLMKMLNAAVESTPYDFLTRIVTEKYGVLFSSARNEELSIIRQAIGLGKLKPEAYDPMFARLVYSKVIDLKEKESVIFAEDKGLISATCDLPLKLGFNEIKVNGEAFEELPVCRENERIAALNGLSSADLRALDNFRPVCFYSESDYVLETYIGAVERALAGAHVERIDVGELREFDFEPTKNNVFLRSLDERRNNVYLLVFKGEFSGAAVELTKSVLKSDRRRKFRLNYPGLTFDLSSVLPVCFCDEANMKKLGDLVEPIKLLPVQAHEKEEVINDVIEKKRKMYFIGSVGVSGEAMARLCSIPFESAEKTIDMILRDNRKSGETLEIGLDIVNPYLCKQRSGKHVYGFGGNINEND